LIKTINDATIIVPMIKDYYDVGIKNDEQLVKLASVVQRLVAKGEASGEGSSMILSEDERKQLMEEVITISKGE
jgi:dihydrodipicolinate synthase/N-acetylneuraminate lyase